MALVQFNPINVQIAHQPSVKLGASLTDPNTERKDRAAIDAREAFCGADADALAKCRDSFNLFFKGKNVHPINP